MTATAICPRGALFVALALLVGGGCGGTAGTAPAGYVTLEGRVLDGTTREPVSRASMYLHFFCDDLDVQVSLDPEDATTYRVFMPGKTVRVRVADKSDTYYLFEETITVDGGRRDYDILLRPTGYVTLHGRVVAAGNGQVIARERGNSETIGDHGPLFYFGSETDSFARGMISADESGAYSLKVPRAKIDIAAVDTALDLAESSVDLTGYVGDSYEFDIRLE